MSELLKAADEIGKLIKMFQALETLRPAMAKVGSLEQAAKEAQAVLDAQSKELAKLKAEQASALKGIAEAKDVAAALIVAGKVEQSRLVLEGTEVSGRAKVEAKALRDSAAGFLAAEQDKEKAELESLVAKTKAAQSALDDIERRTAAAKETLRRLAGV